MTVRIEKPAINVREELADLRKPTGIAGEAMLRADTPQEQFQLIGAGRRNLIINGKNTVNQRGLTPVTGMGNNTYYVDRWVSAISTVSANLSLDSSNMPTGFFGGSRQTITATSSATGYMGVIQKHENHTDFEGQTLTYSGWVKSNHPHAELRIYWASGKTATVKHSGSGEWEYLSVTFTVSSTPTSFETQVIVFDEVAVPITSGDYISFTGVQLEVGKVATPFEHRSYGEELALCQRYYEQLNSTGASGNYAGFATGFSNGSYGPVLLTMRTPKRTNPTFTYGGSLRLLSASGTTTFNIGLDSYIDKSGTGYINLNSFGTSTGTGYAIMVTANNDANAYFAFDAEL